MSGTTWAVLYDGATLTWERLAGLWYQSGPRERHDRPFTNDLQYGPGGSGRYLQEACPLEFDVAEGLTSKQSQDLLLWLQSWLPDGGRPHLRLKPTVPTSEMSHMRPHEGGKPVRL